MSNPIRKLFGQAAVYGLSVIIGRALNFLLVPIYTSQYVFPNPKDYGVVSELYAWVAFLIILLPFGMETAFFKFFNDPKRDKEHVFRTAMWSVIAVNLLFLLPVLLFYQGISNWMMYPDHPEYIIILAFVVAMDAITAVPMARLRAENQPRKFATIQLSSIGVNIALNFFFLFVLHDPGDPAMGVTYILLANLLSSLVKPIMLRYDFTHLRFELDMELVRKMIWYSFPLVVGGFAGIINETLDRVVLKQVLFNTGDPLEVAEAQVGIYSACYKLAALVTILLQAYRYAAEPFFFANTKPEDRTKLYGRIMNYFVAGVSLVFLVISVNLQIFKYFIPSEAYWEGLDVVPILLLANVFLGVYFNQSIWYKLSGQTRFGAYIAVGGALVTISVNFLLIPVIGFYASAWATLIVYAGQMVASYFLGQKHYPIRYNLRKFFLYVVTALVFYLLTRLLGLEDGWVQFFVHNVLVLLFVGLVYVMEKPTIRKRVV